MILQVNWPCGLSFALPSIPGVFDFNIVLNSDAIVGHGDTGILADRAIRIQARCSKRDIVRLPSLWRQTGFAKNTHVVRPWPNMVYWLIGVFCAV